MSSRLIDAFLRDASTRLPGALYGFNVADFKRRNMHLGHARGDADIVELDRLLRALPSSCVARTGGDRWLALLSASAPAEVVGVLDAFARIEPFTVGWEVRATKHEQQQSRREVIGTEIARAVRCVHAEVRSQAELEGAVARIAEADWSSPVNRIVGLGEAAAMKQERWKCISRYPTHPPTCPFCESGDFAFDDGDGHVYSGDGTCNGCGASISIHDVSECGSTGDEVSHYRILIVHENGARLLRSRLSRAIAKDHPVLAERPPWDLPLVGVHPEFEGTGAPSVVDEALPRGAPSTRFRCDAKVPPFVHAIASRIADANGAGRSVGELHPKLVFVDDAGELAGCAQRPLRAERALWMSAGTACGMAPMFFDRILTPTDLRGNEDAGAVDDAFRLAAMIWYWRRGRSAFAEGSAGLMQIVEGKPPDAAVDDLDRLLARAFGPAEQRPGAADIAAALRSFSGSFGLSRHQDVT